MLSEALQSPALSQGLAITAGALLVFVSVAVIYLSIIEWRDRGRRRKGKGSGKV